MEYYICTEIRMKCETCNTVYNIQAKYPKPIHTFNIVCRCGGKAIEDKG